MDGSNKRARVVAAPLDEDDERLFASVDPILMASVLGLKRDDPEVTEFMLQDELDDTASRRLGDILGQNTQLKSLTISHLFMDVTGLCIGLQNNKCIKSLEICGVDLSGADTMAKLAPFLTSNPSLHDIDLSCCHIGSSGIRSLSNALAGRTDDTLRWVNLDGNPFGDINLDEFVAAFGRNGKLDSLSMGMNGIGLNACTSLASLLKDQESTLEDLCLCSNSINDGCTCILAASLSKNTKLKILDLHGNSRISAVGWRALLGLVCSRTNIKSVRASNHTLESLHTSLSSRDTVKFLRMIAGALGACDASLLRASLKINRLRNKAFVAQQKELWGHARGDYNIGDFPLDVSEIPPLLSRFGNPTDETIRRLVEFQEPPLPESEVGAIRLDSVYRILRSTPDLWRRDELTEGQIS